MLTVEQQAFVDHIGEAFVEACPGAGKTRAIVSRIHRLSLSLPPRKGVAVLSFTNTAVDEFKERCFGIGLEATLQHPGFIGTFDAFIRHFFVQPGGIPGVASRPHIIDSWNTLGIEIRLAGANAFRGSGVSLDLFNADDGIIDPATIQSAPLRQHVQNHQIQYQNAAAAMRTALRRNGTISSAEARIVALQNLDRPGWADAIGLSLAARFSEIIVDEAQDCNGIDLGLLDWLKGLGINVTIVCDPDQAIYEFRHCNLTGLGDFKANYAAENQLSLTGNFRSSPHICRLAASLRDRADPDNAIGDNGGVETPIQILVYGATVQPTIGECVAALAAEHNIPLDQTYILAHGRNPALKAAGKQRHQSNSVAKTVKMAEAVESYWASSGSARSREHTLLSVEKLILQLSGIINDNEPVSKAVERNELNKRWLRRTALSLLTSLSKTCEDTDYGRTQWLESLRSSCEALELELAEGQTINRFFSKPRSDEWSKALQDQDNQTALPCATVHEAKGREYEAVCFVIQPNRAPQNYTEQLFASWDGRVNDEAKRVAYVAITRAKKFAAIAVPSAYLDRLTTVLDAGGVEWELHDLTT